MDADGNAQHPGGMTAELELSLDNLEAVLADADTEYGVCSAGRWPS